MRDRPHPNHKLEWPGGVVPEWAKPAQGKKRFGKGRVTRRKSIGRRTDREMRRSQQRKKRSAREVGRDGPQVEVALVDPGALDSRDDLLDRVPDDA